MPAVVHSRGAFSLVMHDRYLLLLGVMLLLANLVNTQGEYILADTVKAYAEQRPPEARAAFIGGFYGRFYSDRQRRLADHPGAVRLQDVQGRRGARDVVRVAGGGVGRLRDDGDCSRAGRGQRRQGGGKRARLFAPEHPAPGAVSCPPAGRPNTKGRRRSTPRSSGWATRWPAGLVFVGLHVLSLSRSGFAVVNVLLVLMWLVVAVAIARRHRDMARDELQVARARLRTGMVATTAAVVVLLGAAILTGRAAGLERNAERRFPDRPVAWHEHDDANVARAPEATAARPADLHAARCATTSRTRSTTPCRASAIARRATSTRWTRSPARPGSARATTSTR